MTNEFPTFPGVLAEASPLSLNDLAIMSPEEMSPTDELAYIEALRANRLRYEKALGAKPAARSAKARSGAASASTFLDVDLGGATPDAGELF